MILFQKWSDTKKKKILKLLDYEIDSDCEQDEIDEMFDDLSVVDLINLFADLNKLKYDVFSDGMTHGFGTALFFVFINNEIK